MDKAEASPAPTIAQPSGAQPNGQRPAARQNIYRQREASQYKGVTKSSGTNSGVERYDVQIVFSDGGSKKHPKIYGFISEVTASRAFDILVCKRAMEKKKSIAHCIENGQDLGTNHSLAEYNTAEFIHLLTSSSRDDVIYGLKQVAKRGLPLEASTMCADLAECVEFATKEAEDREKSGGEARQSYEAKAPTTGGRKRKNSQLNPGLNSIWTSNKRKSTSNTPLPVPMPAPAAVAAVPPPMNDLSSALPLLPAVVGTNDHLSQHMVLAQLLSNPQVLPGLLQMGTAGIGSTDGTYDSLVDPGRPPNGFSFLLDICRLAGASMHPELNCLTDLLRIWDLLQKNQPWDAEHYTIPAQYYKYCVEALKEAHDLHAALTVCHGLFQSRELHNVFAAYVASLSSLDPNTMQQQVPHALEAAAAAVAGDGDEGPVIPDSNNAATQAFELAVQAAVQAAAANGLPGPSSVQQGQIHDGSAAPSAQPQQDANLTNLYFSLTAAGEQET